jgi:hypothetical protein
MRMQKLIYQASRIHVAMSIVNQYYLDKIHYVRHANSPTPVGSSGNTVPATLYPISQERARESGTTDPSKR